MKYLAIIFWFLMAALGPVRAAEPSPMDYVEFSVKFIARSKTFYASVFGWNFTDYGPSYASFTAASIGGGFTTEGSPRPGGHLMVFYVKDLDAALERVKAAGGQIVKPPFTFPGGRRFHFTDPDGYEVAVWSQK